MDDQKDRFGLMEEEICLLEAYRAISTKGKALMISRAEEMIQLYGHKKENDDLKDAKMKLKARMKGA